VTSIRQISDPSTATIDVAIICFNRPDEVRAAVDSCLGLDFKSILVLDNGSDSPVEPIPGTQSIRSSENLGACGGRNLLAALSSADLLLFLDDDATLSSLTSLKLLLRRFDEDEKIAVVAGLVQRADGSIKNHEFPMRRVRDTDRARECGYFLEGAFLVRRTVFRELGGFDESFFYAHEATDFSLRLASRGWKIWYDPALRVIHRPSQLGRSVTDGQSRHQLLNRFVTANRSLPQGPRLIHKIIWGSRHIFIHRKKPLKDLFHELRHVFRLNSSVRRRHEDVRLKFRHVLRLHQLGYRIFW
jgi:GT2 family glycosyltransferase